MEEMTNPFAALSEAFVGALLDDMDELPDVAYADDEEELGAAWEDLDQELGALEDEYAMDGEVGRPYRSRLASMRAAMRNMRQRASKSSSQRRRLKRFASAAKKAVSKIKRMGTWGAYLGFPVATMSGTATTVDLICDPDVSIDVGRLIVTEAEDPDNDFGISVVSKISIGIKPMLGSVEGGLPIDMFYVDSATNYFKWPRVDDSKKVTITITRTAAPGTGNEVYYSAGLLPYRKKS